MAPTMHRPIEAPSKILKEYLRPYYLKWLYFPLLPHKMPSYFRLCWRYPEVALQDAARAMGAAGDDPDVLFLPMTDWHTRVQRTQHFARSLVSAGHRCFYLNPHLGREFPKPYPFSSGPRYLEIEPGIVEAHVHLRREPVFHQRRLEVAETDEVVRALGHWIEASGSKRMVQMVSFPLWLEAAAELRERYGAPIIYDCHDVLSGFRLVARSLVDAEENVFRAADLVVFSSRHLLETNTAGKPWLREKSVLIRNAVEEAWLLQPELRDDRARQRQVVIGYIGALDFWFDIEAVEKAARKHPEWRFELVGRVEDTHIQRRLAGLANVYFRGEIPHGELHARLAEFDVGLIPFLRNELTMGTNPIKLYEYFSHGMPVVSVQLPELEDYSQHVYLYQHAAEFVTQLERAVEEPPGAMRRERMRVARNENWTARTRMLREAMHSVLSSRMA